MEPLGGTYLVGGFACNERMDTGPVAIPSFEEFESAIDRIRVGACPGVDGVPAAMLQVL